MEACSAEVTLARPQANARAASSDIATVTAVRAVTSPPGITSSTILWRNIDVLRDIIIYRMEAARVRASCFP